MIGGAGLSIRSVDAYYENSLALTHFFTSSSQIALRLPMVQAQLAIQATESTVAVHGRASSKSSITSKTWVSTLFGSLQLSRMLGTQRTEKLSTGEFFCAFYSTVGIRDALSIHGMRHNGTDVAFPLQVLDLGYQFPELPFWYRG